MEVLKEGTPYAVDITCTGNGNGGKGCGAELRASREDMRWFAEQEFPWRIQPAAVTIRCPGCGTMTDLLREDWPRDYAKLTPWTGAWRDGKTA